MPPEAEVEDELAQALVESSEEPAPDVEAEGDATPVEEPAPSEPSEPQYSEAQIQAGVDLVRWLEDNPSYAKAMAAYATGQFELVPRGQQAPIQEEAQPEDDDPVIADLRKEITALRETVSSYTQTSQQAAIATARESFQSAHGLSDEEMNRLYTLTERSQILPTIVNETDPFGAPKHTPVSAVNEAFERTYWSTPEFRERELAKVQGTTTSDHKRQRKHAALSGTSGSVPRQNPEPKNPEEAWQQVVAELESLGRGE